ncbi:MAG: hypothetical protein M0006_05200 [Magnetospirillum sp.]|nr:hypothetical protein [Magnetospirillum sp.]
MSAKTIASAIVVCIALTGCENMSRMQQRALSGGAIGAASGLAITALTGGAPLAGALIGAAGGAAIGAVTTPKK